MPANAKSSLAAVAPAVLVAALGWLLSEFTVGSGLVRLSYDLLLVSRGSMPVSEAVMVFMDEKSHTELRQSLNAPWDRAIHARLLDRLTAANARAVVFDIVFSGASTPEADGRLAEAMKRNGRVLIAADVKLVAPKQKEFFLPDERLHGAVGDDRVGSAEMEPDRDMIVRTLPHNENELASLSWAAARMLNAPIARGPEAARRERWLNYYGPANSTPGVPYYQALDTNAAPDEVFRGKVVFVGANLLTRFSGERKDEYRTPYTFWISEDSNQRFISGVEIQATACLNLLRGDWLERLAPALELALLVLFGAVAGGVLIRFRPLTATLLTLALLAAVAGGAYGAFIWQRLWFAWLIPVVQLAVALLWSIIFNSIRLYVENRLYIQSLELYLSPKLVKKFANDRTLLQPGARKQMLTLLFTDIANFTSISEGMDSDELAKLMNRYFQTAIAQCIHPTDGTVVKYIGDAIFAFWNAPDLQPDHAARACEAALRFRDQPPMLVRGQPLRTRLGLHTGEANVGNFGSTHRLDYTALGENINLASRMEGLNKFLGTHVLLTGDTQRLVADRFVTRALGRFRLKGFEKHVEVFELVGLPADAEASRPLREAFAEALRRFQAREFTDAAAAFQRVLALTPGDGPSQFYLQQMTEQQHRAWPDNWAGEVELKEK
ncbi:MAG: adenylate/guanylate cyclase domain-containing protein [Verrucomicrobia bacterium]|nr:adenylate/guanylate cyclase domain-containing protein [Verrucomicrobiota bacterium]